MNTAVSKDSNQSEYYLGLDIGTASVGWAVTNAEYELVKKHRKHLWGVRLFDTADTAAERRLHRAARRRHQRRLQRQRLLKEIFQDKIDEVDPHFFERLKESSYHTEDRSGHFLSILFNDESFKDTDYFAKFPTIFHLRSHLIHHPEEKPDIRILYLAIHSILKHRGHFLFPGESLESVSSFNLLFDALLKNVEDSLQCVLHVSCSPESVGSILKKKRRTDKKNELMKVLTLTRTTEEEIEETPKKLIAELIKALSGTPFLLSSLFENESYKESELDRIEFDKEGFEDKKESIEVLLEPEEYALIETLEGIYNWTLLSDILNGEKFISDAKVSSYAEHKNDLKQLKLLVKKYAGSAYYKAFKDPSIQNNYAHYIGTGNKAGKKVQVDLKGKCLQEDVNKYLYNLLKPYQNDEDSILGSMLEKLEQKSALPKQRVRDNRVIPHQLHLKELQVILDNAQHYFPFLAIPDADGYTPHQKIVSMLTFRIPYYVGPLNTSHMEKGGNEGFCWMVRQQGKEDVPIFPWNWYEVVDKNASAEKFITRMTNSCTYLFNEEVLPKYSLLYNRYMVLNELNNLKINGEPISVDLKQKLYDELFLKSGKKNITLKMLQKFLVVNNIVNKGDVATIEGIDNGFANSLKSYIDFAPYLEARILSEDEIEKIIEWKAYYVDDATILKEKIAQELHEKLTSEQIDDITKLVRNYKGWGRLSRAFLEDIYHVDRATGEGYSIIHMMWETNENLMELLSSKYDYLDEIQRINNETLINTKFSYESLVKPLSVSPPVKRQIWQTLLVVHELKKVMGKAPKRVFVEMAREEREKKRTTSRKESLRILYDRCKNDITFNNALLESLETKTDAELRNDRLYFYYTQMGRCPYCGGKIELDQMNNTQLYDIDHIYPQSLIKDDSLNNRVLAHKTCNGEKGNSYPISSHWQNTMIGFWNVLLDRSLISKEKYARLTRTTPLNEEELFAFINRQLVETRQSTKVVASILKNLFQDEKTEIVYVKARNVSSFRADFEIKKSRLVNDHHHAHDAYLNIVVGNAFHTKFTADARNFIKELRRGDQFYNASNIFSRSIQRNGRLAWIADERYEANRGKSKSEKQETGTIVTVRRTLQNHQVLVTRQAVEVSGALFKLQPLKKKKNLLPLKGSSQILLDTTKYGGYNAPATAYFALVEHEKKGKPVRQLVPVPILYAEQFKQDANAFAKYCVEELNLHNPIVLESRLLKNQLVTIRNFHMSLSGSTEPKVLANSAVQLVLNEEKYDYVAQIDKYLSLLKKVKDTEVEENAEILAESLHISKQDNLSLYEQLLAKERDSIYRYRPANQAKFLEEKKSTFESLEIKAQCEVLVQIINLFTCTPESANLTKLGGGASSGIVKFQSQITDREAKLIHQSPTGIFTKTRRIYEL
ncbi:type II CRISPR RNA-guided endonuclease Cas9 [Sphaerochaeta sp. S2]|uniref:type II CRISPR RNA-guided endonuclease Cas9 n=1 Tax=Sphaerochaeta sp. S2 TaxID=2798868 RepID=UPI0018EA08C1|nr:type II CRISPR RNA-guided endonuclease Cas9 [Sphaerochaeta sp. S2]MBJ2357083.1 type II CRISPR RNA-guided endonuclease Cas9 [Sphaerochaeta sp. S2]